MARYVDDYQGISGHPTRPRGLDPNYREGYGGLRMQGGWGQAEYGRYRFVHEDEMGDREWHGFGQRRGLYAGDLDRGYERVRMNPESGRRGGGVRDLRRDRRALREFNASSPSLGDDRGYDVDRPRRSHDQRYRFGYANRGLPSGGYGEGWAWGPMRGAR